MNMKKRALLVTIVSTAVLGSTMLLWQDGTEVAQYTPRTENSAAGFAGAEEYYKMLRANVNTGEIEEEDIIKVRKAYQSFASNQQKAAVGLDWIEMGPDNIGGRTRALIFDNQDPTASTVYAGSVTGGLFKTTNLGSNWAKINNSSGTANLNVTTMAQTSNGTIYVGTGEGFLDLVFY